MSRHGDSAPESCCAENREFLINFHQNLKNKNLKNEFSLDSVHSAYFQEICTTSEGGEGSAYP